MTDSERNIMEYIVKNLKPIEKVEMSLEKYEDMRRTISDLKKENASLDNTREGYEQLLRKIGIPGEMIRELSPNDISVEQHYNPMSRVTQRLIQIEVPGDWRMY